MASPDPAVASAGVRPVRRFDEEPALAPDSRSLAHRHWVALLVGAITVLALALRWALVHQSLFGDELFLYVDVRDRGLRDVLSTVHTDEKTPPLGFVLGWFLARIGDPVLAVRLPSLAASVASVPLVYLLGLRTVGQRAGLVAAAWFAISPFELFYGTETRAYALVTAFTLLSTLALLAALDERRPRWWVVYAAASAAAVYSHYIAVLVLAPQAAWALWAHRERAREVLVANGLVLVAFLPWLPFFVTQARNSGGEARRLDLIAPLTLHNLGETLVKPLVGHPYVSLTRLPGRLPLAVLAALALALLVALALRVRRRGRRPERLGSLLASRSGLLGLLAIAPVAAVVAYSLRPGHSFLLPRNISVAVPAALLLAGALLTFARARVAVALCVVALAAVSVGTVKMLGPGYQRTDARAAARYIEANVAPGATVVDFPGPHAIRVYLPSSRRIVTVAEFGSAQWAQAARSRTPVVFTFPGTPELTRLLAPPPGQAARFRLARTHRSPGVPFGIGIKEYEPR